MEKEKQKKENTNRLFKLSVLFTIMPFVSLFIWLLHFFVDKSIQPLSEMISVIMIVVGIFISPILAVIFWILYLVKSRKNKEKIEKNNIEKNVKGEITKLAVACFICSVVIPSISFMWELMLFPKQFPSIQEPFKWSIFIVTLAGIFLSPILSIVLGLLTIRKILKSKEASLRKNFKEVIIILISISIPILILGFLLVSYFSQHSR